MKIALKYIGGAVGILMVIGLLYYSLFVYDGSVAIADMVTKEQVETEEELRFMQKCGVEFVQGFYLAKPSFELMEDNREIKEKIMV